MKTVYTLPLIFTFLFSCGKIEVKKEYIINKKNVKKVVNIYNEVKIYNNNPIYYLNIQRDNKSSFEVLINDFPIIIDYAPHFIGNLMSINEAILKPGKQKLTIRMMPPVDKDYYMGYEIDMQKATLKLDIKCVIIGKDGSNQLKEVLQYELPKQSSKLTDHQINLEFDAIAPYQNDIEGWQNGEDLTKEDENKLFKEVEVFYKKLIQDYENQDINTLASKYYKRLSEVAQINYQNSSSYSKNVINDWIENVNDNRPFIFDQYQLRFYGNGKMVALVQTDRHYINLSALLRKDPATNEAIWYNIYLYRPKPGAPLEVIR